MVNQRQGSIQYQPAVGSIVINLPGTYYIYCQIHYYNEREHLTGHLTYLNGKAIMESVVGITNTSNRKHFTQQHGGLFKVDRNDQIQVKLPFTHNTYAFSQVSSYFGAFRVGP